MNVHKYEALKPKGLAWKWGFRHVCVHFIKHGSASWYANHVIWLQVQQGQAMSLTPYFLGALNRAARQRVPTPPFVWWSDHQIMRVISPIDGSLDHCTLSVVNLEQLEYRKRIRICDTRWATYLYQWRTTPYSHVLDGSVYAGWNL